VPGSGDHREIVLAGYSGHGFVVAEAAISMGYKLSFYTERYPVDINPFGLAYAGFEGDENFLGWQRAFQFILGIGNNRIRQQVAQRIIEKGSIVINVIHPDASVGSKVLLGKGVFIARHVSVNPLAEIGDFTILNTSSVIEHECKIGQAAHIAPGAVLAGNVEIGNRAFIGANSVVKQGVKIGDDSIIGAGSVVLSDIPAGSVFVGNPAKRIK